MSNTSRFRARGPMVSKMTSKEDHDKMREAGMLASLVLQMLDEHIQPGMTTGQIDALCHEMIVDDFGAVPACLNYKLGANTPPFPKSVCTSANHVVCHGIPSDKKLKKGDTINVDVALIKDGYYGDTSKMYMVGKPTVLGERLAKVTQECLYKGIEVVKPGVHIGDIGHAIQEHAHKNNFSVVREFCGHGVGKEFHMQPQILHFGTPGTGMVIEEGMIFTIEPMINAGGREVKLLPDMWTIVTKDHKPSAQWEHTLLVNSDGVEVLTIRKGESF